MCDCCLGTYIPDVNIINMDVVNKSKCNKPIIYDGYKIPLKDKSVNVTVCAFVLHHVKNQIELLKK